MSTIAITKIGYISKAFGFKGDLRCELEVLHKTDLFPKYVWIYIEGKPVPFFVEKYIVKEQNLNLKLEDIDSEIQATLFKNTSLYCISKEFDQYFEEPESLDSLIGFEVFDQQKGFIGTVESIIENSIQPTLSLYYKDKEVLIPYAEELILSINENIKKIEVNTPPGLIDLYLE